MSKEILRKLAKAKLSLIDETRFTEKSSLISKNLIQLMRSHNVIQDKKCIGAFAPIAKEPLWYKNLPIDIEDNTAYPAYGENSQAMTFKMARRCDLVIRKDFGFEILGPSTEAFEVIPDVILIPGLAFSEKGERLGRGKGFYDKYLSHYHGIKIGICFSEQLENEIPIEKHDIGLDYIVTDEKIINCKLA